MDRWTVLKYISFDYYIEYIMYYNFIDIWSFSKYFNEIFANYWHLKLTIKG